MPVGAHVPIPVPVPELHHVHSHGISMAKWETVVPVPDVDL